MRRFLVTALLLGLLSVAVSACGDDDEDDGGGSSATTTSTTTGTSTSGGSGGGLSKEEYIAEADALCKAADRRETEAGAPGATLDAIKPSVLEDMVANLTETVADLRQLEAPEGDEDAVAKIVSDLERVLSARADQLAATRANDSRAEDEAQNEFVTASTDLGASAGAYGLTHCQTLGF